MKANDILTISNLVAIKAREVVDNIISLNGDLSSTPAYLDMSYSALTSAAEIADIAMAGISDKRKAGYIEMKEAAYTPTIDLLQHFSSTNTAMPTDEVLKALELSRKIDTWVHNNH